MREFDLETPLACPGPFAEDLENERGAVEYLGAPGLLQIALLHRADRRIDDHHLGFERLTERLDLFDLAGADKGRGRRPGDGRDQAVNDLKADSGRQRHRLFQTRSFGAAGCASGFPRDMHDHGAARLRPLNRPAPTGFLSARQASPAAAASCSCSWTGPIGMTVEMACL